MADEIEKLSYGPPLVWVMMTVVTHRETDVIFITGGI